MKKTNERLQDPVEKVIHSLRDSRTYTGGKKMVDCPDDLFDAAIQRVGMPHMRTITYPGTDVHYSIFSVNQQVVPDYMLADQEAEYKNILRHEAARDRLRKKLAARKGK